MLEFIISRGIIFSMTHYVCKGDCKTVSEEPGVCQADFCNKKGEELKVCGCEDGSHGEGAKDEGSQENK